MSLIQRNKRGALIYLYVLYSFLTLSNHRLNKICGSFWEHGGQIPEEQKEYLTNEEIQFFATYKKIIQDFGEGGKMDLDLTKDLDPPKDLYLEVRVVKDCGEIMTADGGCLKLEKNSTHYLKITDVFNYKIP